MLSLDALQVLDSIERKGSFAAAAEELYRVPSAVTYSIKKLEEQLNVKLFDRSLQKAKLTPTGKLLLERGRDILQQVQRLEAQTKQLENGWEGELRIVIDTILPIDPLWPAIKKLQQQQPWLNIKIMEEALSGSWEALVDQRADLVIGVTGDAPTGGYWHANNLGNLQTHLYCATSHPASELINAENVDQVIDERALAQFIHIAISDSARKLLPRDTGLIGLKQFLYVANMEQKYNALINAMGITHLPEHIATPALKKSLIIKIPTNRSIQQNLNIAWPKNNTGKACKWLREKIHAENLFAKIFT
jgi:DNA-binding transcriptional LysR family regulator